MFNGVAYFKVLIDNKGRPEDLVYVRVNTAFEWMTGLKKKDVLGRKMTKIFPDIKEMDHNFIQILGRVALTGEDYQFEQYFEPLARWFTGSAYCPEKDHCAVIFSDITNLKLTEASLIGTKDQLESKNEELEAFVYTAAHDLRTPLTSALGYYELVQHRIADKLNEVEKDFMNSVPLSLYKLDSLLRDLLEFSKMDENSESIDNVHIKPTIDRIVEEERVLINDINASITVEENLPPVHIHETRLYQLFKNLISNSLKYARGNIPLKVEITLSREHQGEAPSNYRVFAVKDNGIGIDQDFADKIFNIFVQKETGANSGSGVGLAIAKRIVDLTKGKIWAESTLGEETVIYISLPVANEKGD
jgi:signal transduction histidine kinase